MDRAAAHARRRGARSEVRIPAWIDETLDEMERDVERLNKIAQRFSHVGPRRCCSSKT